MMKGARSVKTALVWLVGRESGLALVGEVVWDGRKGESSRKL